MKDCKLFCQSFYVAMPDSTRLAVTAWLPQTPAGEQEPRPVLLSTTRYWRAVDFKEDNLEEQSSFLQAHYFHAQGYVLVSADARGSGASFGCREAEISPVEVQDIGALIEWVAEQPWCDGRVATTGTSYTANTSLYSAVTAPDALKMVVCRAPDFDAFRFLVAPGGVVNRWFIEIWGATTAALDNNDVKSLFDRDYWPEPPSGINNLLGVRPVDEDIDGSQLKAAVREHKHNFNLVGLSGDISFYNNDTFGSYRDIFDPSYQDKIEKSQIPIVIRCGWHDAGTALGALSMFRSFNCPIRVILGPWNHGGDFRADPFQNRVEAYPLEQVWRQTARSLDSVFAGTSRSNQQEHNEQNFRQVEYFTLGENRWKQTPIWPPPTTQVERWYLSSNNVLDKIPPESADGADVYKVDVTTGTGTDNRWHAQSPGKPILFPDRHLEDKKLLVYDSVPLAQPLEITGHPVVHLSVRSSASDGQFFVYLETVDPDGRVRLLTEGQLRGLHRKVCDEPPPYKMFGPYHSLKEKDAEPLVPGEVSVITFDLFPISVMLQKGQRIRLAIAGADKDVFAPIKDCESPEIIVERNSRYRSFVSLPIVGLSCV